MRQSWDDYDKYKNRFYPGQRIVAVDACDGSMFKNGQEYVVSVYKWRVSSNPIANGRSFWYIGIVGHADGNAWFHPGIFAPLQANFIEIEFSKVRELEKLTTSAN
jgi:hypothetical protein